MQLTTLHPDHLMLRESCLVLTDSDIIGIEYLTINDICLSRVKHSNYDCQMSSMVMYDGTLGQKVLKLRLPKVRRNGTNGYKPFYK